MDTTLEVRIDAQAKELARLRAQAQGYTLSEAVRQLLDLWVEGLIDLAVIERAQYEALPKMEELKELAAALRRLSERLKGAGHAVRDGDEAVKAVLWQYERVLKGDDLEPRAPIHGLPEVLQRAILGKRQDLGFW